MSTTTQVSVEEYLSSAYDPDVDYVDGELENRNGGEKDHAKLQFLTAKLLDALGNWFITIETRIRVSLLAIAFPTSPCTTKNRKSRCSSRLPC
jgi:hypothetical protein